MSLDLHVKQQPASTEWLSKLARYQRPNTRKAVWQMLNTFVPYLALWVIMIYLMRREVPYVFVLPFAIVAAGLLVRIFVFFHDCAHDSFFPSRTANRVLGYVTGIMTFTPFDDWKRKHALHHAGSGNLDKRGIGDVWTMTVEEYYASPFWTRVGYRLYRHPVVLLLIGPLYLFFVIQRIPTRISGPRGKRSVHITNAGLLMVATLTASVVGWKTYLLIQLPVMWLAGMFGIWLFYVQHQYEDPYWAHQPDWDPTIAAMQGSSYYKLPKLLQWFSGSIGLHHIHHLRAGIPNYNLQQCFNDVPAFQTVQPLTLGKSLKCIFLNLWDEDKKVLVSFRRSRRR